MRSFGTDPRTSTYITSGDRRGHYCPRLFIRRDQSYAPHYPFPGAPEYLNVPHPVCGAPTSCPGISTSSRAQAVMYSSSQPRNKHPTFDAGLTIMFCKPGCHDHMLGRALLRNNGWPDFRPGQEAQQSRNNPAEALVRGLENRTSKNQ
jgi:hypothetical protein